MVQNGSFENDANNIRFDEKNFLRKARLKSTLRIILISLGVAIGVFMLSFVLPEILLQNQENRINEFYPDLVKFSEPNTIALRGKSYNVRLFGRQLEYYLIRLIADKPYPAGTTTVDFDIWGGEQTMSNPAFSVLQASKLSISIPEGAKEYIAPYAVPKLRFYHPAANHENIAREFDALKNIPRDNLVEMALSFKKPLTFDEMKALMPGDLKLMWGAVSVFKDEDYKKKNYLDERLVGNPYLADRNGEKEFVNDLERLGNIPSYHSDNIKRTTDYLKENGIKYYGVVAVGSPSSLEKLSSNQMITGAVLGIVTTSY
ncbi:sigma factor regulator N-terminal domain-containing protein [Thermoanaerobacterium sp. DL9XJH110]|jgi:hypothetical protein|uniref:sigma factor regulator N-terminal domain-containing protein n=1 Tax=Thermoanaerobacterium sp. DL9XJH110 TaxID=3386643 RepID=UPI003BB608E6